MSDCINCKCTYIGSTTTTTDIAEKVSGDREVKFTPVIQVGQASSEVNINISPSSQITLLSAELRLPDATKVTIPVTNNKGIYNGSLSSREHTIVYKYEGTPAIDGIIQTQVTSNGTQVKLDTKRIKASITQRVDVDIDDDVCDQLKKMNEEKVKDTAIVLKHTQPCHWAEETSKGFYGIWCVLQNVILTLCYILDKIKGLQSYDDSALRKRIEALEKKPDKDTTYQAGSNISINGNVISANVQSVDLSGYVPRSEYNKVKGALDKIIANLESSGAWSGGVDGGFTTNRNIATGNINVFGGTPDGNSFIRTNSGSTENDLAGGI